MQNKLLKWMPLYTLFLLPWLGSCSQEQVQAHQAAPEVPVILAEVTASRVETVLPQIGSLSARDEVIVRTEAAGEITELLFEEGRDIKEGEVLIRLNSRKIKAQLDNLEAKIRQLTVRQQNKKKELERNQSLLKQNLVAAQQYENLQAEIEETEAEIAQAQADLRLQNERFADTTITAPISGAAGVRNLSAGDYLEIGDPVLSLVVMDPLDIQFKVPEKYIPFLSLGQTVQIQVDAYPDRQFPGEIVFLSPQVDLESRAIVVKAQVANPERLLKPGMFARVLLVTDVREQSPLIPTEALIQTEDELYIYTVDEQNTAHKVLVTIGESNENTTEILQPALVPGTRIILEGKYAAKDGKPVKIKKILGHEEETKKQEIADK